MDDDLNAPRAAAGLFALIKAVEKVRPLIVKRMQAMRPLFTASDCDTAAYRETLTHCHSSVIQQQLYAVHAWRRCALRCVH
jgi:DALR domain